MIGDSPRTSIHHNVAAAPARSDSGQRRHANAPGAESVHGRDHVIVDS